TTPVYEAHTQLLIEKDSPKVGSLQTMFQEGDGWYNDDFYQTQIRILESRSLARQTAQLMKLPDRPMAAAGGSGPFNVTGAVWGAAGWVKHQIAGDPPKPPSPASAEPADPLAPYVGMVLGSLNVAPVRNSRLVDIAFTSSDPQLAADLANAHAKAYIQQSAE